MRTLCLIHSIGLCLLLGASLAGCGKSSAGPMTAPVSGVVTYQGQPVVGAAVAFYNLDPDGKAARGTTDANGKYKLSTFLGGASFKSGAQPGQYVVLVTKDPGTNVSTMLDEATMKNLSPEEQQKKAEEAMVGSMKKGSDQKLAAGAAATRSQAVNETAVPSTLPVKYADTKTSDLKVTVKDGENDIPLELKE